MTLSSQRILNFLLVLIASCVFFLASVLLGQYADSKGMDEVHLMLIALIFWVLGMLHALVGGLMALKVIRRKFKAAEKKD